MKIPSKLEWAAAGTLAAASVWLHLVQVLAAGPL